MLVDLAGSESLLKAVPESSDDLARRQALGINRVLSNLASAIDGSATIGRSSALTSLLKDCLGGGARTLLVANIGPELRDLEETVKTLTFAQGLVVTSPVRNVEATSNPTDEDEISLLQMKKRHLECISKLKEKASDSREEELEDRRRIQQEMAEINNKLLTKDSAEQTMGEMRREQFGKIDEMKDQMTQAMREQLDQLRKTSYEDMETLRRHVEKSSLEAWKAKKETEEHEAKEVRLQAELQQARQAGRDAEAEASALKVRLATAEERRNMLQERQEELRKERIDFDEERKGLRHQGEQQWQRMTVVEAELQKFKSGAEAGGLGSLAV
ncbi:unnamed protein product [Polarella glacialis]|uniref:Kinesin motor domain-containing protein n=1 Tax=Polarella glacialis TaxID=89957 RepID=A0A813F9S9_POLGL|nr:unnamed protein product [Polarella glacialis]